MLRCCTRPLWQRLEDHKRNKLTNHGSSTLDLLWDLDCDPPAGPACSVERRQRYKANMELCAAAQTPWLSFTI